MADGVVSVHVVPVEGSLMLQHVSPNDRVVASELIKTQGYLLSCKSMQDGYCSYPVVTWRRPQK